MSPGEQDQKKQRELAILRTVFPDPPFRGWVRSERPDFVISPGEGCCPFGVEVTEFHLSESRARMEKLPGYCLEIIQDRRYRHKADVKDLRVEKITIHNDDGSPGQEAEGIVIEHPAPLEYVGRIADCVRAKGIKLAGFRESLTHVDLVILDRECLLRYEDATSALAVFTAPAMRDAVLQSGYREVFLVTRVERDRWVYVPMALFMTARDAMIVCMVSRAIAKSRSGSDALVLFGEFLSSTEAAGVFQTWTDGRPQLHHRGYVVDLGERGELRFTTAVPGQISRGALRVAVPPDSPVHDPEFHRVMSATRSRLRLSSNFMVAVKSPVPSEPIGGPLPVGDP